MRIGAVAHFATGGGNISCQPAGDEGVQTAMRSSVVCSKESFREFLTHQRPRCLLSRIPLDGRAEVRRQEMLQLQGRRLLSWISQDGLELQASFQRSASTDHSYHGNGRMQKFHLKIREEENVNDPMSHNIGSFHLVFPGWESFGNF